jgi:hypothetical protein
MLFLFYVGCAGKDVDENDLFQDDVSPVVTSGSVWCNTGVDENGPTSLFFLEAYAQDPQGDLDLYTEATWTATIIENDQLMVEDFLYWEDGKYVYSFHQDQQPNIKCDELSRFRFTVQTTDWSGNQSNIIDLEVLGYVPADN